MPNADDNERDFWVGITAFGAVLGTGLYALVEHEWWFGAIYTIGGGAGLMWMSPAAKSYLGAQPSKRVLIAAIAAAWLFLAANIGYSVYNKWLAPTYAMSSDDIAQAKAHQSMQDQKQIDEAQDAARAATTAKEMSGRNLAAANQQLAGARQQIAALQQSESAARADN
jgi:hypothetical protein